MVRGQLHHLIEHNKWDTALHYIKADPTLQADTIQTQHNDLPLHMACDHSAPDDLILEILKLNTDATFQRGNNGDLPLHIASKRNVGASVIEALIRANSGALDCQNEVGQTPRRLSHTKPTSAFQALQRPTCCWRQLMQEEKIEEAQDGKLTDLHKKVDEALASVQLSNNNMDGLLARVEQLKDKVDMKSDPDTKSTAIDANLLNVNAKKMEIRLQAALADKEAAEMKDFMARAASQARSSDVLRVQRRVAGQAEELMRELEKIKAEEARNKISKDVDKLPRPLD